MVHHLFLTGKKRIGKTTLLKKVLDRWNGKIGGFATVRTNDFLKGRYSVHLLPVGEKSLPEAGNVLFVCGETDEDTAKRFDFLGCRALSDCSDCSLIVLDELGPHEAEASLFRKAVLEQLDGDIPIFGVLQAPAKSCWPEIVSHPSVQILEITEDNREQEETVDWILTTILDRG